MSGETLIAHDVAEQLEQREDQQQHQESADDHGEIEQKVAQHIVVEDGGEAEIERRRRLGSAAAEAFVEVPRARLDVRRRGDASSCRLPSRRIVSELRLEPGAEPSQLDRAAFRLPEQKSSSHQKTKSASQTPAAGDRRPCRAKDTPIKEIE